MDEPNVLLKDLKQAVAERRVIAVVGAGISVGATRNAPCASWGGLLRDGVHYCRDVVGVPDGWEKRTLEQINSGMAGDLHDLLSAAEQIAARLGAPNGGDYARWLQERVGCLRAEEHYVLDALRDLDLPLATTNYDHLLETATGRMAITWQEEGTLESVLRGDTDGILHLHGDWSHPSSVVLGIRSYEEVKNHPHTQAVLRALAVGRTLLFVGCGAGLEDPNFGRLLEWTGQVLPRSPYRHFRLCLEDELPQLRRQHPPSDRLFPIPYGERHADLAPFIRSLREPETVGPFAVAAALSPTSRPPAPARIPGRPHCFGRDGNLEALAVHLVSGDGRPALILGGPGVGKSTLALAALHDARVGARYGERRWVVHCDAVRSRRDLAAAVAQELGLPVTPQAEDAIRVTLAAAPSVLVLDNLETPWEAEPQPVQEILALLAGVPGLALVATLRGQARPFGIAWREPFSLLPLELPDARRAFLEVAGYGFTDDSRLDDLLGAVECLPLAVTLLAYVAQSEPDLEGLWSRWQDRHTEVLRLPGGTDRLTNLEVSLDLSCDGPRMTSDARRLASLLGILPSGIAYADLGVLLPGVGDGAAYALRQVGLAPVEPGRVRVLAPVREYLHAHRPPERRDAQRARAHYLMLASRGREVGRGTGAEAVARLAPEAANIEQMLLATMAGNTASGAIAVAPCWRDFLRFTGMGSLRPLSEAARAARAAGDVHGEAGCTLSLGIVAFARADVGNAQAWLVEALSLYGRLRDVMGEANCIFCIGQVALSRSDHPRARTLFGEAMCRYRSVGAMQGEANCIASLGDIDMERTEDAEAQARYEGALGLYRRVGDALGEANCICCLGEIEFRRPNHTQAAERFGEALPLYRKVGSIDGEAACLRGLGEIALAHSDHEAARRLLHSALSLCQAKGDSLAKAHCIRALGNLALVCSEYAEARARYDEALTLSRHAGSVLGQAICVQGLGDLALACSDREQAQALYEESLQLYQQGGAQYSVGKIHRRLWQLAATDVERCQHLDAARAAWEGISRLDLVAELDGVIGEDTTNAV